MLQLYYDCSEIVSELNKIKGINTTTTLAEIKKNKEQVQINE